MLEDDPDSVEDYIEEALDDGDIESEDEWTADMVYPITIGWPENL